MSKQDKQFKWIPINLLSDKIQRTKKRYGNYKIAVLSDNSDIVIDNNNLKVLVIGGSYFIDNDFEQWSKKGFIVVKHAEENKDYILDAKNCSLVFAGYIIEKEAFLKGTSDYFIVQNT
ncbi:MAG: hypothetical protein ACPLXO_04520, partial [Desulfurella sp.]